jgi:hypothetical protein
MEIGVMLTAFFLQIKRFLMNGHRNPETGTKYVPTKNPDSGAQLEKILLDPFPEEGDQPERKVSDVKRGSKKHT